MPETDSMRWEIVPFSIDSMSMRKPTPPVDERVLARGVPDIRVLYEHITPNSEGSHNTWKAFEHYKAQSSDSGTMGKARVSADISSGYALHVGESSSPYCFYGGQFGNPGELNSGLDSFYVPRDGGGFVPAPSGLVTLNAKAVRSMLPVIRPDLSLVNSLIELKDFKSLPGTLRNVQRFGKAIKAAKTLRYTYRTMADCYLQTQFNILPLLSDITGIWNAVRRARSRINDFLSREGRTRVAHYQCFLNEFSNTYSETPYGGGPFYGRCEDNGVDYPYHVAASWERSVTYDPSLFHAQIQYRYFYTDFQRKHASALERLDRLGLNLNPAIIWNAIKFSFVVDWLFGVNRWLNDHASSGWMTPRIDILQYLWSIKRRRRIDVRGRIKSGMYGYGLPGEYSPSCISLPSVYESAYRRSTDMPGASSFETSGLSLKEFSLAAALGITMSKRKTNH